MNLKLKTFSFALLASASTGMYAQTHTENNSTNDSEPQKKEERNVMLNASDANKPREIQIGLPSEDVTVYENGLPAVIRRPCTSSLPTGAATLRCKAPTL